ncbi:proline-rich protein 36-like [Pezoporus occidentalis]|uniref:proline-rich protein 36-like n=1 Tax=Pezoporus occidentalis TaxID=407982 RepID=UPI002F90CEE2
MKKSECPQLRNARNPRRNAYGLAAAAPPTHLGLGGPRGAPRRPSSPWLLTSAPPSPASARSPRAKADSSTSSRGTATTAQAGTRTWGKEPPLFTAGTENSETVRSHRSVFSELPRPSAAHSPRSPQRRHSRRSPAQPRGTLGGKACPYPVLHRPPRALPAVVEGEPCCSPLAPERKRHPWPLGKSVFNGARWRREATPSARGATSTAAGGNPTRRRPLCLPRSAQVAPQPSAARPRPSLQREDCDAVHPHTAPRASVATSHHSPHPSRAASPCEGVSSQLRAPLAVAPPGALAAGAENGLPAPSSGGGGCRSRARAGPGRGGARRGALPQN